MKKRTQSSFAAAATYICASIAITVVLKSVLAPKGADDGRLATLVLLPLLQQLAIAFIIAPLLQNMRFTEQSKQVRAVLSKDEYWMLSPLAAIHVLYLLTTMWALQESNIPMYTVG